MLLPESVLSVLRIVVRNPSECLPARHCGFRIFLKLQLAFGTRLLSPRQRQISQKADTSRDQPDPVAKRQPLLHALRGRAATETRCEKLRLPNCS